MALQGRMHPENFLSHGRMQDYGGRLAFCFCMLYYFCTFSEKYPMGLIRIVHADGSDVMFDKAYYFFQDISSDAMHYF